MGPSDMVTASRTFIAALLLALLALGPLAGCSDDKAPRGEDDLRADLASLRDQIAQAEQAAGQHKSGLLGEMAAMRREVLLLSAAMLENRLIANESGVPAKLVAPARLPDQARAEQLLRHIAATEATLEEAREATGNREGVAGSLSQTAVVTQELTLAQLRLAYFQSAYGLALPGQDEAGQSEAGQSEARQNQADGSRSRTAATAGRTPTPAPARAGNRQEAGGQEAGDQKAGGQEAGSQDISDLLGSVKSKAAGGSQAAALPPLEEVDVPQLPPVTYSHNDYARIQLLLEDAGFDPGPVDGQWGPRTARAMTEFQRARGLPADGEPDAETLDALGFY